MLLILLLCTQWGVDNLEVKYFHPISDCRFQRAESIHSFTEPGYYSTRVNQLPAGVYFCNMETPVNERVKKLVVIK
ncbi:MAG: hypothetical protein WBB67_08395 [bacterium]